MHPLTFLEKYVFDTLYTSHLLSGHCRSNALLSSPCPWKTGSMVFGFSFNSDWEKSVCWVNTLCCLLTNLCCCCMYLGDRTTKMPAWAERVSVPLQELLHVAPSKGGLIGKCSFYKCRTVCRAVMFPFKTCAEDLKIKVRVRNLIQVSIVSR